MHTERDIDASLHFPQFLTFGYSFRPTPKWNFEADVDWTDWNYVNTLNVHQQGGTEVKELFDWSNSLAFEFGATRELGYGLRLSVGYIYTEHAVPENRFDPLVPDGRRHIFCFGLGQTIGRFNWDIAYQYAYQPSRSISNSATGNLIDGDYRLRANAFSISIGYAF
jgi:long-chain fatty acid transport protein